MNSQGQVPKRAADGEHAVLDEVEWIRCYYDKATGNVITSMHAHTDGAMNSITKLTVTDANGQVIVDDSSVSQDIMSVPSVQVTYATTRNNFHEMVLHIHNYVHVHIHVYIGIQICTRIKTHIHTQCIFIFMFMSI